MGYFGGTRFAIYGPSPDPDPTPCPKRIVCLCDPTNFGPSPTRQPNPTGFASPSYCPMP